MTTKNSVTTYIYFSDNLSISKNFTVEELINMNTKFNKYGLYMTAFGQIHKVDNILIPTDSRLETIGEYVDESVKTVRKTRTRKTGSHK